MSLDVCAATSKDIPQIHTIYAHYVEHTTVTFEEEVPSEAELYERMEAIGQQGLPFLVAKQSDQIVGYAYVVLYRKRSAYRFTVEESIYVHPDFVGQGIGRKLLEQLIIMCKEAGYKQMLGVIAGSDNNASLTLHTKLGFKNIGVLREVGYKFDQWVDTVIMQRAL